MLQLPRDSDGLATSKPAMRRLQELLTAFLEDAVVNAGADGLVVPLDGSLESLAAATLAVDAIESENVTGLIMPVQLSDEAAARDAEAVASVLGIEYHTLQLQPLITAFQRTVGTAGEPADDIVAMENANARFRMACAYYVANTTNRLVLGTVNRTQRLLGSVAKYGQNGVDLALFGDLFQTEIEALARDMNLPTDIVDGPQEEIGNIGPTDAEKLEIEPETLDSLLHYLIDEQRSVDAVAEQVTADRSTVERVRGWAAATRHKRHQPPKPSMRH